MGGVGAPSVVMHDDRSKIMNIRIFSCGDSAVRWAQQAGND